MSIEQTVYCRILGQGENLILLHGWGSTSAVWQPVVEDLSQHFCLHLIDLPGFGQSKGLPEVTMQAMVDAIIDTVPAHAIWCGWSLGGLVATFASYLYPEKISQLIQVCSSVKFVSEASWPGVTPSVFADFKRSVLTNKDKTLARFIAIQAMGCATARKDAATLKKLLAGAEIADAHALLAGLDLLNDTDLREVFSQLKIPCLSMFGQFDTLLPLQTRIQMHKLLPHSQQKIFADSAHAPFVTESGEFSQTVINLIYPDCEPVTLCFKD